MAYQYINLEYLYKHSNGKMDVVAHMLHLSKLNVQMYRKEMIEYFVNASWYKLAETAFWAKQKLPLVGLVDFSAKMNELEKLTHKGEDVEAMEKIIREFDEAAPKIIEELEEELQKLILE